MPSYYITDAQLADMGMAVRNGNALGFATIARAVRKKRAIERDDSPVVPKRVVYFCDFIMTELNAFLDRTDMNNLLRSASYLRERKRDLFYWRLTPEYSYKYYNSSADARGSYNYEYAGKRALFADVLNARLRDTRAQLCLTLAKGAKEKGDRHLRKRRDNTIDLAYLENLHALTLKRVDVVGCLSHLATLREVAILCSYPRTAILETFSRNLDMQHFKGCTKVHIQGGCYSSFWNANPQYLQNCRTLRLERLSDINAAHIASLPKLEQLILHDCRGVTYRNLNKEVSLYVSNTPIRDSMHYGLGEFRELHFSVCEYCDMEGLQNLSGVKSLYLMARRGGRALTKRFIKAFPCTKEWVDDGTWDDYMYY
jgi:hypothetical protein